MKQRLLLLTAALAAVATLVVVPMTSASSVDTKLQIGQSLRFLAPGASSGTFVAAGAIRDSGTVTSRAVLTPFGNQDDGRLEGTETFVGRLGTFTTEFSGIAGPVGGAPQVAGRGTFRIVAGTGAYTELRGQGTFLVVVDFSTGQAVRTDEGQAS